MLTKRTCFFCGTTGYDVELLVDPFEEEFGDGTEEIDICGKCYGKRCDDI